MKVNKTKNWMRDHKKGILKVAFTAGLLSTGYIIGYYGNMYSINKKGAIIVEEHIRKILLDAQEKYGDETIAFCGKFDIPVTADQLGVLGEVMIKYKPPGRKKYEFTNFIALGQRVE